jgi:hypothetical protein
MAVARGYVAQVCESTGTSVGAVDTRAGATPRVVSVARRIE